MSATAPSNHAGESGEPARLLAIDKPAGVTSHDVVDVVRRHLRLKRAGHLGTLDPAATGLLLVATGAATRAVMALQGGAKTYEAVVRFGVVTSTQDLDGDVIESGGRVPGEAEAREASRAFVGEIDQVPPMVSALKIGGERLYALARRGVEVDRVARRIIVSSWEWLDFAGDTGRFRVVCSGGTYVRTLAHDLGQRLGCGAALAELRRLRSEPFGLERSIGLRELKGSTREQVWRRAGISLEDALAHLPALRLEPAEASAIGFGGRPRVAIARAEGLPMQAGPRSVVLRDETGRVIALGELFPAPAGVAGGETPAARAAGGEPAPARGAEGETAPGRVAEPAAAPAEGGTGCVEVHAQVVFPWGAREGRAP